MAAAKPNAAVDATNVEVFEPVSEWVTEEDLDTLMVYVPGFTKDKLKVQLTSARKVRISGEKKTTGTKIHFEKEYPIPSNCNTSKISANFSEGIINVKLPKTQKPIAAETPPTPSPVKTQEKPKATVETTPAPVKTQEKPKATRETPPSPADAAKPPKPTTTAAAKDPQLKNNVDNNKISQQQQAPPKQPSKGETAMDQTRDTANAQQQKPSSQKEKQPSNEVGSKKKEESDYLDSKKSSAAGAGNARDNSVNEMKEMEKVKKNEVLGEERKTSSGVSKVENVDRSLENLADEKAVNKDKRGKAPVVGGGGRETGSIAAAKGSTSDKSRLEGLVAVVKKPTKLMNLAVGILCVVVFVLYAKDAITKSFKGESESSAKEL